MLVVQKISLLEIISTCSAAASYGCRSSGVFYAIDSATLQPVHRCIPAPYGILAVPAVLPTIKTCVHENARTQYPPVTISTHWDRLLKPKQAKEEDPPSYAKCFEQQLETVKGYIGSTFTDGFAEQMPEYKAQAYKHDACKIAAFARHPCGR